MPKTKQSASDPKNDPLYIRGTVAYTLGNIPEAIRCHQAAAANGNCESLHELGAFYDLGKGVPQDYRKALDYYTQAAAKGNAKALGALGTLYYYGQGVNQDYAKALDYYQQSLGKGNEYVLYNLGILYERGRGVVQDYVTARDYYARAAANGDANALNNLGVFYMQGYGVTPDHQKARQYFEQAIAGGNKDAVTHLALLARSGASRSAAPLESFAQMMSHAIQLGGEVPLVVNNPPKMLWYADAPPALGGIPKYITVAEFMSRYVSKGGAAFDYTETTWCQPVLQQALNVVDHGQKYRELKPLFERYLRSPQELTNKLVIAYISPEVGFGVFAREKIAAEEIICFYAGIFTYAIGQSDYMMSDENLPGYTIDAKLKGGIARFFQHVPVSIYHNYHNLYVPQVIGNRKPRFELLGHLQILATRPHVTPEEFNRLYPELAPNIPFLAYDPEGDKDIATVNVIHTTYIYDGLPIFIMYSTRDIEAGEQLGITYGSSYWELSKKSAILFSKYGNVIEPTQSCSSCKMIRPNLLKCGRCLTAQYCGVDCQRKDWPQHKTQCKKK